MIYDVDILEELPKADAEISSVVQEIDPRWKRYFLWQILQNPFELIKGIILLLLSPIFILVGLFRFFRGIEAYEEYLEKVETKHQFNFDLVRTYTRKAPSNTLHLVMNYHALKCLAFKIGSTFSSTQPRETLILDFKSVKPHQEGYHIHVSLSEEVELTLGTVTEGLLQLHSPVHIYGTPQMWMKIAKAWYDLADEREQKVILLDKDQADWCDERNVSRLVIEYIP
ncbi:MAG: hypothetical protein JXR91_15050 [Deltaproteobacteria bacterium]|nr:hypothetical protein [Deltaproteobacteria bacterium]